MKQKPLPPAEKWLQAALRHVPQLGWVDDVLLRAAADLKVDAALVSLIFPNKIDDLVAQFHASVDDAMTTEIERNKGFAALKIRQKIAFAVRARLQAMVGQEDAVRRLHGWAAAHPRQALKMLWASCDEIWWAAGDTATDYNHYTKRALLAQLYERTLLFWLNDASRGKADTWNYLDARIDSVLNFGREIGKLKDMAGMAGAVLGKWRRAA